MEGYIGLVMMATLSRAKVVSPRPRAKVVSVA
jgi:hypothetical protein